LALAEHPHVTAAEGGDAAVCLPAWAAGQVGDACRLLARDVLRRERGVRQYGSTVDRSRAREEVPTVGGRLLGPDGRVVWEGAGGTGAEQLGARRAGRSTLTVRPTDDAGWQAVLRGPQAVWMGQLGPLVGQVDDLQLEAMEVAAADLRALRGAVPDLKVC
jgi:hypothetical protein